MCTVIRVRVAQQEWAATVVRRGVLRVVCAYGGGELFAARIFRISARLCGNGVECTRGQCMRERCGLWLRARKRAAMRCNDRPAVLCRERWRALAAELASVRPGDACMYHVDEGGGSPGGEQDANCPCGGHRV